MQQLTKDILTTQITKATKWGGFKTRLYIFVYFAFFAVKYFFFVPFVVKFACSPPHS
jgi:hypothetical protein